MSRILLVTCLCFFYAVCQSEELLVNSREIYPNNYAYIIQTGKDSASLKNPSYAINTDIYAGLKKKLWVNVVGFGNTANDLAQFKKKYPDGYIRKLGQYRKTSSIDRDSIPNIKTDWVVESNKSLISDTQFVSKNSLLHIIRFMNLRGIHLYSDTFSISTESEVTQVFASLYRSRSYPLIVERSFYSAATGAISEIRIFPRMGRKCCAVETFTNEEGPEEPRYELNFDPKTDQPFIQEYMKDLKQVTKLLFCNKE